MKTQSFKDLLVWQKSINLVKIIYDFTNLLPSSEKYGLASQLQRAAVSVPSNIAEGYKRNNLQEYIQFCSIAEGSLAELETQIIIADKIFPNVPTDEILVNIEEVQKMLFSLTLKLKQRKLYAKR